MRRLALAANDREVDALDPRRTENAHSILRIMSNLFTSTQHTQKVRRVSEHSKPSDETPSNYAVLPTRRSTVYIKDVAVLCGIDIEAAKTYVFPLSDAVSAFKQNAELARQLERFDHERLFAIFQVLVFDIQKDNTRRDASLYSTRNPLTVAMMEKLWVA